MRVQSLCISLAAALSLVAFTSLQGFAATSAALHACSKQWDDMKAAGKTEGTTWSSFWSQCSKDFAAAPAKLTAKKATAKSTATARNEDDGAGSAELKKDCDAKWDANKTKTGAHWHDYFQFMSKCM
jgi:Meckel syndrome type 1 protein